MNHLFAIACALAEGARELQPDREVALPLEPGRSVHLLREPVYGDLVLSLSHEPVGRTPREEDAAREALLRLSAATRWTIGWVGALDEDGRERITQRVSEPLDAALLDADLAAMLRELPAGSAVPASANTEGPAWLKP